MTGITEMAQSWARLLSVPAQLVTRGEPERNDMVQDLADQLGRVSRPSTAPPRRTRREDTYVSDQLFIYMELLTTPGDGLISM